MSPRGDLLAAGRPSGVPPRYLLSRRLNRPRVRVSEVQRSRVLHSAVQVVSEQGYGQMSIERVTARAGVARSTFYDLFEDREDCFLAAFEDAVARATDLMVAAYEREQGWRGQVRSALAVLLWFFDSEPGVGSLLIVDALNAGPRVLERRAQVLEQLGTFLQEGGSRAATEPGASPLAGEFVVGALFSVVHTRLLRKQPGAMIALLNPSMGTVVLPFLGPVAAREELERPAPEMPLVPEVREAKGVPVEDLLAEPPLRITYRTLRVLTAIAELSERGSDPNNREVADLARVSDQGQISKLLARLERLGLIHNTGGHTQGVPKAWRLTPRGEEILHAGRPESERPNARLGIRRVA
jgi:AcrR family transcriptional regulator